MALTDAFDNTFLPSFSSFIILSRVCSVLSGVCKFLPEHIGLERYLNDKIIMVSHSEIQAWIDGYVNAWRSPDTSKLDKLFTDDINYRVSPWRNPLNGLRELKSFWETARSGPNEVFDLQSEIVAIEDKTAVARVEVEYANDTPSHWRDLWIIIFDSNGLCSSFEEWPFSPEQDDGQKI